MKFLTDLTKHLINATRYSFDGIIAGFRHEYPFRIELVLCLVLVPAAFFLAMTYVELILLLISLLIVLMTEIINSAIEVIIDRISTDIHPLSKRAKDYGSAAVFFALMLFCVTWTIILVQHF